MERTRTMRLTSSTALAVLLFLSVVMIVQGGAVYDWGTVGLAEGNYLAWVSTATPPIQVLTEDGYNPGSGVNQGFIAGGTWILDVGGGFTNPAALPNGNVEMLFGGLGGNTGTIVKFNFAWNSVAPDTFHTVLQAPSPGLCPTMIPGSRGTDGQVINWTLTGADGYAIYRSVNGSGAGNSASNGRYDLVTTVSGTTTTFTDTDNACKSAGSGCWHIVVPLNATNQISGCHGEESSPTAVALHTFHAADPAVNWPLIAGVGALAAILIGGLAVARRRAATH